MGNLLGGDISVSIGGELFAFDGLSVVTKNSHGTTVIETGFDEISAKLQWELHDKEVYFHLDSEKLEIISP